MNGTHVCLLGNLASGVVEEIRWPGPNPRLIMMHDTGYGTGGCRSRSEPDMTCMDFGRSHLNLPSPKMLSLHTSIDNVHKS